MRHILCAAAIAAAIASGIGCSSSEQEFAATPAFSPPPGTYTSSQEVTLSCTTPSAVIHYTIDGSLPTSSSPTYTTPISVASTTTIQAMAVASGFVTSGIATGTYTIQLPGQAATPTFSPGPGTYTSPQSVTLACTTANATIYYTVDGSVPTSASALYEGEIAVSSTMTIKAIAVASGFAESGIASGVYTITPPVQVATPSFTPAPGTYPSPQSVTITCATAGATIHYTTDGSGPTTASQAYTGPITVAATTTIKALAAKNGLTSSEVASGTFTISTATPAATPTFSPPEGAYTRMQFVTLSSTTPSARIYYTYDGSTPTTSSWLYHGPIEVAYVVELKAIAVADGLAPSQVAVATYDIRRTHPTAAPTFSPAPGSYASPQQVTLSCATPNAQILYTTDGTLPDIYSHYHGPIAVSSTTTIWAAAYVSYVDDLSDLAMATYTIAATTSAATPTFSPPPGEYTAGQVVTLSCATPGATIYYTVDESAPGPGSTVYTGPLTVSSTTTIKAIAIADGYASSGTATGTYAIHLPGQVATPTFSPPPGTYGSPQSVTLSCATPGAWIVYWIVEDNPRWATTYTGPIDVSRTMTIKTYALGARWEDPWSDTATGRYIIGAASGM